MRAAAHGNPPISARDNNSFGGEGTYFHGFGVFFSSLPGRRHLTAEVHYHNTRVRIPLSFRMILEMAMRSPSRHRLVSGEWQLISRTRASKNTDGPSSKSSWDEPHG